MIHWLRHNWRLKLVSLFLAVVVWTFVNGITNDRRLVQAVPLEVRTRAGATVLQQNPVMVDVTVRGTREDMRQVSRDDLVVTLDLTDQDAIGENEYRLGTWLVRHPRWAQPIDISPGRATVVVDEIVEVEVPIAPLFVNEPADGYKVGAVVIDPPGVRMVGPNLRLKDLASIATLPIDLAGRQVSFRVRTELSADGLADLSVPRRFVTVNVEIGAPELEPAPE